jgi:hypothetical protein
LPVWLRTPTTEDEWVIIGVRTSVESFGPAYPTTCTRCRRSVTLHYSRREHRRSVLFIPVTRVSTEHVLSCPSCFRDEVLSDDEQGAHAEALTRSLAAFRRGDLPECHFHQHVTALWRQAGEALLPAPAI